ncbi:MULTISPECIES: hypothetical protein [unclassified Streptomyces]|uniref:hypothetical protein n=1 Tax=unclassified Streptomyces TaxID=2593676 RepID=UPI0037FE9916
MPFQRAVACGQPACIALYLAPPRYGLDAVRAAAIRLGWDVPASGLSVRCPGCRVGSGPVTERGLCPCCGGSTTPTEFGAHCTWCGRTRPYDRAAVDSHPVLP